MNSDKKIVIIRDGGPFVKVAEIDLFDDGKISSFNTEVFANNLNVTDEAILNWAKKDVAVEEAPEVEIVHLESFINDPGYQSLVSNIQNSNTITAKINDDPSTTLDESQA